MARLVLLLLCLVAGCAGFLTMSEKVEICSSPDNTKCIWIDEYIRTNTKTMSMHAAAPVSKPSVVFCYQGFESSSLPLLLHSWQGLEVTVEASSIDQITLVVSNTSSGVHADSRSALDYESPRSVNVSSVPYFNPYHLVCFGFKRIGSGTEVDFTLTAKLVLLYRFLLMLLFGLFLLFGANRLSRNVTLFYGTGVTLGVVASLLILLYIFSKFVPKKNIVGLGVLLGGYTVAASVGYWLFNNLLEVVTYHWQYVLGYVVVSALISFGILYRMGPVTNSRTFDLIQWSMQLVGMLCVFASSQTPEMGVAGVVLALLFYWVPVRYNPVLFPLLLIEWILSLLLTPLVMPFQCCLGCLSLLNPLNWFIKKPKIRLLTMEEYEEQGRVETEKALKELREHVNKKKRTDWATISRLKDPKCFTEFLSGRDHVSDVERVEHEWSILEDSTTTDEENSENGYNDISTTSSPHVSSFEASRYSSSSRDDSLHSSPSRSPPHSSSRYHDSPNHRRYSQPRPSASSYTRSPRKHFTYRDY